MGKNGNYCLCPPVFYLAVILVDKIFFLTNKRKSWPKDGKIIRPVRKNVILTVRELPFCLSYHLFGSLMPACYDHSLDKAPMLR